MFHLNVRHFIPLQPSSSLMENFDPKMFWIIWFLCSVLLCECSPVPDPDSPMFGEVQSPQYPQPYPPNLQQQWELRVPEGFQIRLTFTHLDIEAAAGCYYDSLTVLHKEKLLGKFCGTENSADGHHPGNHPILSPGNTLMLIFQTDDDNPERHQNLGFSAQYQAIDVDECSAPEPLDGSGPLCSQICLNTLGSYLCACHHGYELRSDQRTCVLSCGGGIFDEPEGHLFSPGYPMIPPHAVSCQYIISVEPGFTVSLNFSDNFHIESVDTEDGLICLHHWLLVTIPDREPIKLCGGLSPGLMETNSSTVKLDYHTDDKGQSRGWSLDYRTQRVQCPVPGRVANGRVTPVLTEYFYRDYLHVRCDQGYKLMMEGEEIQSFFTMCVSSGRWHLSLPECHIIDCGEPEPLLNGAVTVLSGFQNQYRSVVQYHCNQPFYSPLGGVNVTFRCDADRQWRSTHDVISSPTCLPVCGQPTKLISGYQRIIGGSNAPHKTIPWQVMLSVGSGRGGGMVIADRWILTAAHVLVANGATVPPEDVRIYMGHNDVKTLKDTPVNASSLYIHPGYKNPDLLNYNNDIALMKLDQPITFDSSVMPLCLPAEGATYDTGVMGLVSGFGITINRGREVLTNRLKYVQLPVVDQETCSSSLSSIRRTRSDVPNLTENMFCAGVPEGSKDSCQGDSGSAFTLRENGRFYAAGIVSWGIECGKRGTYGVYTRVSNYLPWINNTIQNN
ncbi:complement C1r-A subcomponent-like [Amphiprion ocellaris]|uniref:complement subcomponent C1r n=1 Tax=Amphiprion ocellaris TaxID=80972 RepID=A0A3Q1CSE7_AMPOC|nr:complement C1r-A subcomponent-like [Amphiprion ocellaris]